MLKKFGCGTIMKQQVKRYDTFEVRSASPEPGNDGQGPTKVMRWSDGNTNWRIGPMLELRKKCNVVVVVVVLKAENTI